MKKPFLILFLTLCGFYSEAQIPTFSFGKRIGGTTQDAGKQITMDKYGNIFTIGTFRGTVDFDPGVGTYTLSTSTGYDDIFISKLDNNGNFLWAKRIGITTVDESVYGLSVDSLNNVLISGSFYGTNVDFDPGTSIYNLNSVNGNFFVLKLDEYGNFKWVKQWGVGACHSIATDENFNYYLAGQFNNIMDFDPNAGIFNMNAVNGGYYVLKLDSVGSFIWAKQFGGLTTNELVKIHYGADDYLYLTGAFYHNSDFNPGPAADTLYSINNQSDIFILKLDKDGNYKWAKSAGGSSSGNNVGGDIDVNELGEIFVTGWYYGTTCSFGTYTLTNADASGINADFFICKMDSLGNFLWAKKTGGTGDDRAISLSIDKLSNILVTGTFRNNIDFDPGTGTFNLNAGNNNAIFIQKLNTNGGFEWASQIGYGTTYDYNSGNSIFIKEESVLLTGSISRTVDIDPTTAVNNLVSAGGYDVFILKLNQCFVPTNPINTSAPSEQNICTGSIANLSVSTSGTANWYSSPSSTTTIATGLIYNTPTLTAGTYTYYVAATTCTVSPSRTAITVTVNANCQDVWPGDANSDGTADNLDVLELGLHYTQTGTPRASVSNSWQSFYANNWTGTISNGKNVNHSDCNGDGVINVDDTLAIFNNYGLTHVFKQNDTEIINPQLSIMPDQSSVVKGSWGSSSIYLGDVNNNITNINGVAFSVDFDNSLIEPNSIWIEYINSFINAGDNLHFRKLDFINGKIYTATTHTLSNNVNGNGKIAVLHYQIKSNLSNDAVLNLGLTQANQSSASGNITPLTSSTATVLAVANSVGVNNVLGKEFFAIYPNPTSRLLNIKSTIEIQKVELVTVTGQLVMAEQATNNAHVMDMSKLANGVYFLNLYKDNKVVGRQRIILNK